MRKAIITFLIVLLSSVFVPGVALADVGNGSSGLASCVGVQTVAVTARYIGGVGHYTTLFPDQYGNKTQDVFTYGVFGEMCGNYHPYGQH